MTTLRECARQLGTEERLWYATENLFGVSTSWGYSNGSYVIAFDTRAARDLYVVEANASTCQRILFSQVSEYGTVEQLIIDGETYAVYMTDESDDTTYWVMGEE